MSSFPDTELTEDIVKQIVAGSLTCYLTKRVVGGAQVNRNEIEREALIKRGMRGAQLLEGAS